MHSEQSQRDVVASSVAPGEGRAGRPRISRRQAMGRMTAVASAGAAAWVVPEILMAKPAAGASLSGTTGNTGGSGGVSTSASTGGDPGVSGTAGANGTVGANGASGSAGVTTAADADPSHALAFTGLNIQRDAEVGAALIAGGWAMQHWASRTKPAVAGASDAHQAESAGDGS
jgi:hypothetical protein